MEENLINISKKENIINLEPIKIEQNNNIYVLNIAVNKDIIIFSINDIEQLLSINYIKTMNFKEIKELNKVFYVLNSINDFYEYLKLLSNNKKLNIKKSKEKISIILNIEVLLKEEIIEINLNKEKIDLNLNIKNICKELIYIKEKIKDIDILKNENKELREKLELQNKEINKMKEKDNELIKKIELQNKEINKLKKNENEINELKENVEKQNKEINNIKERESENKIKELKKQILFLFENAIENDKSVIMKDDERNMIFSEIENKMNKKIIKIKKLYQATIDGGNPIKFHSKCDNIENTLVIIKSKGLRRFGGFTPIPWKSNGDWVNDPSLKSFVFSLDNKKIYYLKEGGYSSVYHNKNYGPCFGFGHDIGIEGNPIKEHTLFTYQSDNYDYKGDKYSLSEYKYDRDDRKKLKALEYEVFQVIFF